MNEQYPDNAFVQNEGQQCRCHHRQGVHTQEYCGSNRRLRADPAVCSLSFPQDRRSQGRLHRYCGPAARHACCLWRFVILRIPLNGNFIAALLTILGYSINDTVVIYDRIRENSALYSKKQMSLAELVNLSINQSFARSLMTSITTCLALGVVCMISVIYRLDSIYSFAFPLLFGMVSGVYSTICIATPLWVDWKSKKKAAKKA